MEALLSDSKPMDMIDSDFNYLFDSDVFHNVPFSEHLSELPSDLLHNLFDDDPLLSSKCIGEDGSLSPNPHIQTDHSYSMTNEICLQSPLMKDIQLEDFESNEMDVAMLEQETPMPIPVKQEQTGDIRYILREAVPITTSAVQLTIQAKPHNELGKVKLEPHDSICKETVNLIDPVQLPPSPPSSNNSDSEGGASPDRCSSVSSECPSPTYISPLPRKPIATTRTITQPMFTNVQRLPQSGPLILTEEEKRTLIAEGYPIPSKLPLSKSEEKALKKVRRKIKNKISAQESRRKKKEYVEALERKMEQYTQENTDLKKRVDSLESNNKTLVTQLTKLQSIANKITKPIRATSTQTGTCLMVFVLCFAVFLGSWSPSLMLNRPSHSTILPPNPPLMQHSHSDAQLKLPYGPAPPPSFGYDPYTTPNMRSRMLMSTDDDSSETFSENYPYMTRLNTLDKVLQESGYNHRSAPHKMVAMEPPGFPTPEVILEEMVTNDDKYTINGSKSHFSAHQVSGHGMHPDMEAEVISVETRVNGSSQ